MELQIGKYQFRLYISKLEKRTGVCSQVHDKVDSHVLLWDFDVVDLTTVLEQLAIVQREYDLSNIFVIQSSVKKYHAYCLTAMPFLEAIHVLSATSSIDTSYLRLGIVRGYFTLRITPRSGEKFKIITALPSKRISNVSFMDLTVSEYLTSNRGQHNV